MIELEVTATKTYSEKEKQLIKLQAEKVRYLNELERIEKKIQELME